jgi:hypothetical protein
MNPARIISSARTIEERTAALNWLEQYGSQLDGKTPNEADVVVTLKFAASCTGSKEAASILSSYARLSLPDVIKRAIECCNNDIAMATSAIREELEAP